MRHASLFSGIGGFDLAASWMGWENVMQCEIDPFCQKVLRHHFPASKLYGDIRTINGTDWKGKIDILTGGFPCQPFSSAGRRRGTDDNRFLWPEMLRVIREVQPTWIVAENVRGLVSIENGVVFERVCTELEANGYEVQPLCIPACAVGAPHKRERLWFVAHAKSDDGRRIARELPQQNEQGREERQDERTAKSSGADQHATPNCSVAGLEKSRQTRVGELQEESGSWLHNRFEQQDCDASDTRCERWGERSGKGMEPTWEKPKPENTHDSRCTDANNPECPRLEGLSETAEGSQRRQDALGHDGPPSWSIPWTKAATRLCRVDDGLPDQLDGITVPKWRKESLRAYGNAIVPQVAYQIFSSIVQA